MQKTEYHNAAKAVQTLFVFDFDDTLASTSAEIGVQRLLESGQPDPSFGVWLEDKNILSHRVSRPKSNPFYWMSSANFALYESHHCKSNIDTIDYSQVGDASSCEMVPIDRMVNYLRGALREKHSETIILTARSALKEAYSPALKKTIDCNNKKLIQDFLKNQKVSLSMKKIHAVGDSNVHTSVAKARVVLEHICQLNPETVLFFDDSALNLEAVDALNNIPLETNIVTYQVYDEGKIKKFTSEQSI